MVVKDAKLEIEEIKFRVAQLESLSLRLLAIKIMVMTKGDFAIKNNAQKMLAETQKLEDLYASFITKINDMQTSLKRKIWYREHELLGINKEKYIPHPRTLEGEGDTIVL
jgi:hypothetical protein